MIPTAQAIFSKHKIDAIIILGTDPNFLYLTGQDLPDTNLIITKRKTFLLHSPLERPIVKGVTAIAAKKASETIIDILKKCKAETIGIDEEAISHSLGKRLPCRKVDLGGTFRALRAVKTPAEINIMRRAASVTCDIMEDLFRRLAKRTWTHESDLQRHLKIKTILAGCALAFDPIVASGRNASIPHYKDERPLERGFLIVDFGVRYQGYCCDMSRTAFLGKPTEEERQKYATVLACQTACIKKVAEQMMSTMNSTRPGEGKTAGRVSRIEMPDGKAIDAYARELLGKEAKRFTHSLGHGVGIEVHEMPRLSRKGGPLAAGNVITIEPGIYGSSICARGVKENPLGKGGIRIEDMLVLGPKTEVLTEGVKKDLLEFPLPLQKR